MLLIAVVGILLAGGVTIAGDAGVRGHDYTRDKCIDSGVADVDECVRLARARFAADSRQPDWCRGGWVCYRADEGRWFTAQELKDAALSKAILKDALLAANSRLARYDRWFIPYGEFGLAVGYFDGPEIWAEAGVRIRRLQLAAGTSGDDVQARMSYRVEW